MVITYEYASGRLARVSECDDMNLAAKQLPQGAYTTFRTYHKTRVLRLEQHRQRLVESVGLMGRAAELNPRDLRAAVAGALAGAAHDESRARVTFAPPRMFVSVEVFTPYPRHLYEQGVTCATVPIRRENPRAKNTAFSLVAKAAQAALPAGAHEGLMVAEDGAILEGLSSNFFAIDAAGALRTENERALFGVTRSIVLELAGRLAPVSLRALHVDELSSARECFITSVSLEALPVVRVDGARVGDGAPGPISRQLMAQFDALVARECVDVMDEEIRNEK